ncbi:MAG: 6-carboxytetrahydropterin synthase [Gammaproteobacteria bacterium]|nr:6-carboxytetrahydropterin synthase [Gammaproteobacteria bacterium]
MPKLFVNRLTVIDFSYLHPERGLLGESWLLDLVLDGTLDAQGMVLDFGLIKKQAKSLIDKEFDHKLLVPSYYPHCEVNETDACVSIRFDYGGGRRILHRSPANAVTPIPAADITTATLARAIHDRLQPALPYNVSELTVRLYAESIPGAFYHYSHGLKQHEGHCCRIAHGHRSRIEIFRDGVRDEPLEWAWAERWHDIYIANRSDLLGEREIQGLHYCRFGYRTAEGEFELELPEAGCYLIDSDSTVENLAQHIADMLYQEHPESRFRVQAYEGVDKGAIGKSGVFPGD